jgi:Flp pilus assembly protein TadD
VGFSRGTGVLMGILFVGFAVAHSAHAPNENSPIVINYPEEGSLFPPEITPPTFVWHDSAEGVTIWRIEVTSPGNAAFIQLPALGETLQVHELDTSISGYVPPSLTLEEATAHTWRPAAQTWAEIKRRSTKLPVTVVITGFREQRMISPVSRGQVTIRTSIDPVGAPVFFRDVPLIPPDPHQQERSAIKPLPDSVLPKIKWRLRYVGETQSRTVMEGIPTCINCHSFSKDGKSAGLDVDGPLNDKALYALVAVQKVTSIRNQNVVRWSAFTEEGAPKRFGFMSQISPDGNFVVTSVEAKGWAGPRLQRLFYGTYWNYGFGQVFYPTTGILAWYSRDSGKLQPLPGADNPEYVHTSAFWSPDGKYLIFSRAKAKDAYVSHQKLATFANDPNETQIQYDLYRIPFNGGKGGLAERVAGASENGMSNDIPKVSPDCKWIVYVRNKSGLLMRPDSKLYIVPFNGGEERSLRSNQPIMNSWHSFSPNGRWLVFSSKPPSLYTRLFLTHIDQEGNSTPAILIDDTTASNRAANIPEFLNVSEGGLDRIEAPATEFYRLYNIASALAEKKQFGEAVPAWRKALEMESTDSRAHNSLGNALVATGRTGEALVEYRKATQLDPTSSKAFNNLGTTLAQLGRMDEAIQQFQKAVELNADNASAQTNLGGAMAQTGHMNEAMEHCRRALELDPKLADAESNFGVVLLLTGDPDGAIDHMSKAVAIEPGNLQYRFNLARVLASKGRFAEAVPQLEEAVRLSGAREPSILGMLGAMYGETGRFADAANLTRRALDIAQQAHDDKTIQSLKTSLARYEALAPQFDKPAASIQQ